MRLREDAPASGNWLSSSSPLDVINPAAQQDQVVQVHESITLSRYVSS